MADCSALDVLSSLPPLGVIHTREAMMTTEPIPLIEYWDALEAVTQMYCFGIGRGGHDLDRS